MAKRTSFLISILDAVMIVLEEARNSALGAEIVVHQHSHVKVDGASPANSSEIGVAAHATNDLLLFSVADAIGIVVAAEVVRSSRARRR